MELKKVWAPIAITIISISGLVFSLIALANANVFRDTVLSTIYGTFMAQSIHIAYLVFFIGISALMICKIIGISKLYRGYILLATGAIATIFMVLALVHTVDTWEAVKSALVRVDGSTIEIV